MISVQILTCAALTVILEKVQKKHYNLQQNCLQFDLEFSSMYLKKKNKCNDIPTKQSIQTIPTMMNSHVSKYIHTLETAFSPLEQVAKCFCCRDNVSRLVECEVFKNFGILAPSIKY